MDGNILQLIKGGNTLLFEGFGLVGIHEKFILGLYRKGVKRSYEILNNCRAAT